MAALLGLTLVVLLVHDVPFTQYLKTVESDRIITALQRDGFIIAGKSEESLEHPSQTAVSSLQSSIDDYKLSSGARVIVVNNVGDVVADNESSDKIGTSYADRPEVQAALEGQVVDGRRDPGPTSDELLYVAVPVLNGDNVLGAVRITFPSQTVDDAVAQRLRGILIVAGITLLLAAFVAFVISSNITRRIRELEEATEKFTHGDLAIRADDSEGAPEIRSLARSFNLMAERLNRLIEQQSAFAADASHQLRTPLTALQLRLERAIELATVDPKGAVDRLEAAMLEADRLQRLVEGLLVLSRSDNSQNPILMKFDLAAIAQERVESWEALAAEFDVKVTLGNLPHVIVKAVGGALEQVIDNYIDNALAIAPKDSRIIVNIEVGADTATLHVLDEGPGLPPADLEKAFNRFWRARSDESGSGLGLAIVERLVTASAGSVRLENRQPHGLDAQATFNLG